MHHNHIRSVVECKRHGRQYRMMRIENTVSDICTIPVQIHGQDASTNNSSK